VFSSSLRTKPGKDPANELAGFAVRRQAIVAPDDGRIGVAGRQGVALRGREGAAPPRHRLVQRPEKSIVGKVGWSDDTVWIDAVKPNKAAADAEVTGTVGFRGVHEEVWNFHIGGYQVCEKWELRCQSRQLVLASAYGPRPPARCPRRPPPRHGAGPRVPRHLPG
jgi:hypothetical protein